VHIILRVGLSWVFVQMTCFSPCNGRSDRVFNGALAQELGIGSHFIHEKLSLYVENLLGVAIIYRYMTA
jgi:hypothetical protein